LRLELFIDIGAEAGFGQRDRNYRHFLHYQDGVANTNKAKLFIILCSILLACVKEKENGTSQPQPFQVGIFAYLAVLMIL